MAYGNNLFNAEAKCENNLNDAYKPIQYAIDDQSVTFLPAVSDASWAQSGLNFYNKNASGAYEKLNDVTSMSTLAAAIENIDTTKTPIVNAANVYTDASNVIFYGTVDRSWNNAFKGADEGGHATGLNDAFASLLPENISTIYNFDESKRTEWDSPNGTPKLNGVIYGTNPNKTDEFYGAYESLLRPLACSALSSYARNSCGCYHWIVHWNKWGGYLDRACNANVVLKLSL